jgi:hypothetical protein
VAAPTQAYSTEAKVAAPTQAYSTEAKSDGVRGGSTASDAEELLGKAFEARGDEAVPDGTLADVAAWLLEKAYEDKDWSDAALRDALLRFGFVGVLHGAMTGSVESNAQVIERMVTQVPKNMGINRYGIVAGKGRDVAILIGSVEVRLEDFPRSVAPGATLRLKGEVSERYQRTSIHSTNPEGKVQELPMNARTIDGSVTFPKPGIYRLEVVGDGATGPVVLVNVPIHVGVSTTAAVATDDVADPNLTGRRGGGDRISPLSGKLPPMGRGGLSNLVAPRDSLAAVVFCVACSGAPPVATMRANPVCHVWLRRGMGEMAARVDNKALVYTGLGDVDGAYFESESSIVMPNSLATATYERPTLTMHQIWAGPAVIGESPVTVRYGIGSHDFHFNRACTDRDVALGITSLVVMIAASSKE